MIRHCAFVMVCAALSVLALPVRAERCPTVGQMTQFLRCMAPTGSAADIERCAGGWDVGQLWNCLKSDPAYDSIPLSVLAPRQPLPPPQPAASAKPTCGPQLTVTMAQRIEQANPGQSDQVKALALRYTLEMMGCIALQPAAPLPQTTECFPIGGGAFTCTTR